ncbi:MAG: T9SS type A sorting domain-containing protein, partial [Bacteroidetes bacterium]|nr:T9SS type A sorting domain-containing protein [Bacteroidota bacterium]
SMNPDSVCKFVDLTGATDIDKNSIVNSDKQLRIYPNPVINNLQIEIFINNTTTDLKFIIYNSLGELIFNSNYQTIKEGLNVIDFNISSLSKGLYILNVISLNGEILTNSKFIKSE